VAGIDLHLLRPVHLLTLLNQSVTYLLRFLVDLATDIENILQQDIFRSQKLRLPEKNLAIPQNNGLVFRLDLGRRALPASLKK
jgi:hypothetical protein